MWLTDLPGLPPAIHDAVVEAVEAAHIMAAVDSPLSESVDGAGTASTYLNGVSDDFAPAIETEIVRRVMAVAGVPVPPLTAPIDERFVADVDALPQPIQAALVYAALEAVRTDRVGHRMRGSAPMSDQARRAGVAVTEASPIDASHRVPPTPASRRR
jgi:hypothetical protein